MTQRDWLRRLLEDLPLFEADSAAGDGTRTEFAVTKPPITTDSAVVSVDGQAVTAFTVERDAVVRFTTAPAAGANVVIAYQRQSFADDELDFYLEQATVRFADSDHQVYRAAIYAIDALLMGTATALNFGAGAENFDMVSVHTRLVALRNMYLEQILREAEETPAIVLADLYFPSRDPDYPGGYPDDLYWVGSSEWAP